VPIGTHNIQNNQIAPSIELTQLQYIQPLLCDDLYDELCNQINNDTLTEANTALLCYIKDIHVRYAFADFIYRHPIRVTAESVVRKVSDESEFVDFLTIEKQANQYRLDAGIFESLMIKFLQDNEDTYPLWKNSDCNKCRINSRKVGGFF
jgi:hypothetical protein